MATPSESQKTDADDQHVLDLIAAVQNYLGSRTHIKLQHAQMQLDPSGTILVLAFNIQGTPILLGTNERDSQAACAMLWTFITMLIPNFKVNDQKP